MKWHIDSLGEIYDRGEGEAVYFDTRGGDTHLISEFALHLLRHIASSPSSTEQIVRSISADIEPEHQAELQVAVPGMLKRLAELSIIEIR